MFYLVTHRVYKIATNSSERFAARSTNHTSWEVSGPFSRRSPAERAMVTALGTHTCLSAQVMTVEQMQASRGDSDYGLRRAIEKALKLEPV